MLRGWTPEERQVPVYDSDGKLLYTRVERESEWTPDQVSLMLGVRAYERSLGPHGQPVDEAWSPDSDPSNREGKRIYRAGVPVTTPEGNIIYAPLIDWAERAQADAMDAYKKTAGEGANLAGLVFPVQVIERSSSSQP